MVASNTSRREGGVLLLLFFGRLRNNYFVDETLNSCVVWGFKLNFYTCKYDTLSYHSKSHFQKVGDFWKGLGTDVRPKAQDRVGSPLVHPKWGRHLG